MMELPQSIDTNNPKEAIAFCVATGIKDDILPKDFKMSNDGYQILEAAITEVWERDSEYINEIMVAFISGYATGSKQVMFKKYGD